MKRESASPMNAEAGRAILVARGWKENVLRFPWAWREPDTHAWYVLADAVSLERGRKGAKSRGRRK